MMLMVIVMKKRVLIISIIAMIIVSTGICFFVTKDIKVNYNETKNEIVGLTNKKSKSLFQVKVNINCINIRENANVSSNKLGIVKKGSIFTVIDYTVSDKYIWYHIITANNIEGYIASDKDDPYVIELNDQVDYVSPKVELNTTEVQVQYRKDITKSYI